MTSDSLSQEYLKQLLSYNPDNGVFIWIARINSNNQIKAGTVAGCVQTGRGKYRCRAIRIDGKLYKAHRLAWLYVYGHFPKHQIDHINQDSSDNRITNLRDVTCAENNRNAKRRSDNKTGVTGVTWDSRINKFIARIRVDGKDIHIGCFPDKWDAICARMSANNKYGFHLNHGKAGHL